MAKIPVNFSQFEELEISKAKKISHSDCSQLADQLKIRIKLLKGKDKALMKTYIESGVSFRQLAEISSVTEATVRRRISKLIKRLLGTEYLICIQNRQKLTRLQFNIAKDYYITGLSQNKMAQKYNCSIYCVRKSLTGITELVNEVKQHRINRRKSDD